MFCWLGMMLFLTGCGLEKEDQNKIRNLKFVVLEESQIPEELRTLIEEKKREEFKITFDTETSKYIVIGYGEQTTGGYSIAVEELYETSNAIYVSTSLIGPAKGERVTEAFSYPYVVIKVEYLDKNVVFE